MSTKSDVKKPASTPVPTKRRTAGSGEGSKSALAAMLKKRREGENQIDGGDLPADDDFAPSQV